MRLRNSIVLLLLLLCSAAALSAQDQIQPPDPRTRAYIGAERAAKLAKPDLGTLKSTTWARLDPTTLSNLHCPLVQGVELGREVTVYAITLGYSSGSYLVHVSTDGSVAQLCDSKFGTVVASTPAPPSSCQIAAAGQPTFRIAPDASTAVLGGEVMTNGINYAIGRTDTREWYQTRNKANQIGWISAKEITLTGPCDDLPITGAMNIDYVSSPCFVTTAQDFSNVRQIPSTDGTILAGIYENAYWQVYATTTDGEWVFINPGWVAHRVTEEYGECSQLEVNNSLVGVPPGTPTPFPTATLTPVVVVTVGPTATPTIYLSPTTAPTGTPRPTATPVLCEGNPTGFLPSRIQSGTGTARVMAGGDPNRLREEPSTESLQVGTAQPGRTLDAVLEGPVCSGTYVWWKVRIDSVEGWTVESDSSEETAYYLEPVEGFELPTNVPAVAPAVATSEPTRMIAAPGATAEVVEGPATVPGQLNTITIGDPSPPIEDIRLLSEETIALLSSSLYAWDLAPDATTPLNIIGEVAAIDDTKDDLYWLSADQLIAASKGDLTAQRPTALTAPVDTPTLSMTSDGRYFLTVGCNNADCTQGKIDLWETASGKVIRSQPAHPGLPFGAWFTPDDKHILSIGGDGIQVWDTQSGAFVGGVPLDIAAVTNMASNPVISADSAYYYIAICTELVGPFECTKTQLLGWSLTTSEEVTRLDLNADKAASALAISADDQQIAVGFQSDLIQFIKLDPATTAYVQGETLNIGNSLTVSALAFNADGTKIAVGTDIGAAQLWDVPQP